MRLHQYLDNAVTPGMMPMMPPNYPPSGHMSNASSASRPYSNMPFMGAGTSHISPMTDGSGSGGHAGTSPEGSKGSNRPRTSGGGRDDDVIELPPQQQHMFGDESLNNIPLFADTPAWLTEGTSAPIPFYHRKSSDGATLRLMMDALSGQTANGNGNGNPGAGGGAPPTARNDNDSNTQDPLDNSPREKKPDLAPAQPSPFGSLVVPVEKVKKGKNGRNTGRMPMRRSTTIVTSWTHAPKILVVEDDVVYRQLSSKFLEKFGCTIETVDSAQQAIERMNHIKYDLVLMDIFFGPSMDGSVVSCSRSIKC
jgi:osomolarity two-component system response regulator SKN7